MTNTTPTNTLTARPDVTRIVGIVLSVAGLLDAGYLSWLHLIDSRPALCTQGGGCDIVQNSAYAEIGGLPISLLGFVGYVFILLGLLLERRLGEWGPVLVLGAAVIGTLYSAYLTYLELFVLHAICPYCAASAICMLGLLVVAIYRLRRSWLDTD